MKSNSRIVDELWQILCWMAGIAIVIGVCIGVGHCFRFLPLWAIAALWITLALVCKYWRGITHWFTRTENKI